MRWVVALVALAIMAGCTGPAALSTKPVHASDTPTPTPTASPTPTTSTPLPPPPTSTAATVPPDPSASASPDPSENAPPPAPVFVPDASGFEPHVIVAVPDTGINPYHSLYFRPDRTAHPCTYIRDFPCDIQALPLSVGMTDYATAFAQDAALWASVEQATWYWIPQTVFVAVYCQAPYVALTNTAPDPGKQCILDDSGDHGTGTTSSVIMENPDALLAFNEGLNNIEPFIEKRIPVDVFSVSWGSAAPLPIISPLRPLFYDPQVAPVYVSSAGNEPHPLLADFEKAHPQVIAVGGADAEDRAEQATSAKQGDVVSYYCRPTAMTRSITELEPSNCGTSYSAPTVAGALSKVILAVRRHSGYTGGLQPGGMIDPIMGLTASGLRDAMNLTASYLPNAEYSNGAAGPVPVVQQAPWLQWSWGFYDGTVANATINHLLGTISSPPKPAEAVQFMETHHAARVALYS